MHELNKLRWRCRRGCLELDVLLLKYLDRVYSKSTEKQKQAFLILLDLEDTQLLAYLMTDCLPADKSLANIIISIRSLFGESNANLSK